MRISDWSSDVCSSDLLYDALTRHGHMPLPPYITEPLDDPERYQTTYAQEPGSVAAPTAGLHLTSALLDAIRAAGATIAPAELVVGHGTFRPMARDQVEDHDMHSARHRGPDAPMAHCEGAERVVGAGP